MRRKKFYITDENTDSVAYKSYLANSKKTPESLKMKKIMKKAIKYELTPKQRYCLCEHYLNGKSMKSIACELNLNPSTVTRHIQNALSRLQRVARYY